MTKYKNIIDGIYESILKAENKGKVATYIPELSCIDPNKFGAYYLSIEGSGYGVGDYMEKFSMQSITKVLSLSLAYKLIGDSIWDRVGVEPSGNAYNSLVQLEDDKGIPRNPLINAGALVVCDILVGNLDNPKSDFLEFIHNICSKEKINYNHSVASSEQSVGYRNIALCNYIKSFGNIKNEPNEVLDFYFTMCSLEMTCEEVARVFMFLVNDEFLTADNKKVLNASRVNRVNAIMQCCGFYDESGEFSFKVGLPGKSGVGGGIVAIHPNKHCVVAWSPRLNSKGNSYRGMKFLEQFTTETDTSIF